MTKTSALPAGGGGGHRRGNVDARGIKGHIETIQGRCLSPEGEDIRAVPAAPSTSREAVAAFDQHREGEEGEREGGTKRTLHVLSGPPLQTLIFPRT